MYKYIAIDRYLIEALRLYTSVKALPGFLKAETGNLYHLSLKPCKTHVLSLNSAMCSL